MIIKAVNENPVTAERRQALLPVPVEDVAPAGEDREGKGERASWVFKLPRRWPGRPSAAFLAQLCLQYDDASRQRQARLERTERAARIYDTALTSHPTAPKGQQANFRI